MNSNKSERNQISKIENGYIVFWRGDVVYGKAFRTEHEASNYLQRCDLQNRILD
jgi:hypothetical protein